MAAVSVDGDAPGPRWRRWWWLAALGLVVAVYLPSLSNPFIFDDHALIEHNAYLHNVQGLKHLLTRAGWTPDTFGTFFRPVTMASFWLTYQAAGLETWAYRLGNLLVHLCNGFLLWLLFGRWVRRMCLGLAARSASAASAFAVVLFLLHPVQATGVYYLHKRSMVLFSAFYLVAVLCFDAYLYARSRRRRAWLLVANALAFALALGCRESAVTLPALMLAMVLLSPQQTSGLWGKIAGLVPVMLGGGLYLALYDVASVNAYRTSSWAYLLQQATVIPRYLGLLIWPRAACISYSEPQVTSLLQPAVLLGGLSILACLGAAVLLRRRYPLVALSIVWFFVVISPGSSVVPTNIPMDHIRLYLASAPLLLLASLAVVEGLTRLGRRPLRWALAGVVLLALGAENLSAGQDYSSPEALWRKVVRNHPDYWRGWSNLCSLLSDDEIAEKIAACKRARTLTPGDVRLYVRSVRLQLKRGQSQRAWGVVRAALDNVDRGQAIGLARALESYQAILKAKGHALGDRPATALYFCLAYLFIEDSYYQRLALKQVATLATPRSSAVVHLAAQLAAARGRRSHAAALLAELRRDPRYAAVSALMLEELRTSTDTASPPLLAGRWAALVAATTDPVAFRTTLAAFIRSRQARAKQAATLRELASLQDGRQHAVALAMAQRRWERGERGERGEQSAALRVVERVVSTLSSGAK